MHNPSFLTSRALKSGAIFAFAILFSGMTTPAWAIDVPASATAGQVQKRFEEPITAPMTPDLQLPDPRDQELSAEEIDNLKKKTFLLKDVAFKGISVFTPEDLASYYESFTGKTISLLDAHEIAKKVTARYRNNGYVLCKAVVPPQDVTAGTLEIRVVEGFIGSYELAGDVRNKSERTVIEGYAKAMQETKPTRVQDLERYLLLINDLPGVRVSGLLRPLPSGEVGSAELILNLRNKTFEGSYTLDNRGSKYVGPWQHTLTLASSTTFGFYDRTQARFFIANPRSNELLGGDITYELPLGEEGTLLSLRAAHTHTHPGDSLTYLDIVGTADEAEIKVSHPFMRQRRANLMGRFSFDYKDTRTDVYSDTLFSEDRLRILRTGATYNVLDSMRGNNLVDLEVSQGLDMLDATGSGLLRSNSVGESTFTKMFANVSRVQNLPENFSVLLAGSGQYAFTPLFVDEQFSLGGANFGRAFDSSTSLGDHGIAGKVELRFTNDIGLPYLSRYQLFTFFDMGRVWLLEAATGANDKKIRSSVGVGSRLNFTENFSADLELNVPLVEPAGEPTDYRGNPRLFLSVTARF